MAGFGNLEPVFDAAGAAWNVDPNLLRAVATQESSGNPRAVSGKGAQGLMQLLPSTAKGLGVTDTSDPVQSIWGGAKYLSQGLDAEGTPEGALLYYHGGPDWRNAYGPESAGYVPGVSAKLQQIVARQGAGGRSNAAPQQAPAKPVAPQPVSPAKPDAAPDFDQFLRDTGATTGPASAPAPPSAAAPAGSSASDPSDFDAFLKRTGATVAPPAPTADAGPPMADPYGTPWIGEGSPTVAAGQAAAGKAIAGVTDDSVRSALAPAPSTTYGEVLPLAKDDATGAVRLALPNSARNMLTGLLDLSQGPRTGTVTPEASNALFGIMTGGSPDAAGTRASVSEVGANNLLGALTGGGPHPLLPSLFGQRSVAAGTGEAIGTRLLPPGSPGLGRNEVPDFLGPQFRGDAQAAPPNLLPVQAVPAGEDGAAQAVPGMLSAPPRPPVSAQDLPAPGKPNAAGAQASSPAEAVLTPQQVQAYRSTAEGSKLLEPQPVGREDPTLYVPGVSPNTAEIEQTVNTARDLKAYNMTAPAVSQAQKEIAAANNERRGEFFASKAGSPVDIQNMKDAAEAQLKIDYPAAFANAKPADTQPIVDAVNGILQTPRGRQNDQLQAYVKPLLDKLVNDDGNLKITDPEELYGFREQLRRDQSPASRAADSNLNHVKDQLGDIMGVTDQAIEQAAPGYGQYMDNYAAAQRGIEEKQVLQDFEPKLYDSKNTMQYGRVQNMMKQIVDARSSPGLNPYKSITDDTMENLWRLRDDLRRSASAQELARAPGSDTAQNALDIAKGLGKGALKGGLDLAVGSVAPVYGNLALRGVKNALAPIMDARTQQAQAARGMKLLNPDPSRLRPYDAPP